MLLECYPKANRMFWQKKHLKEHCHIYDGALCDKRLQLHPAITCVTSSSIVDMGEFVRYTLFSSSWKCHDWYTLIYCYVCKMSKKNWPPLRMCMRPFENKSKFLDQSSFSFRLRTFLKIKLMNFSLVNHFHIISYYNFESHCF